jgi:hypothetical protein
MLTKNSDLHPLKPAKLPTLLLKQPKHPKHALLREYIRPLPSKHLAPSLSIKRQQQFAQLVEGQPRMLVLAVLAEQEVYFLTGWG